jgi:hypothetical protein
MKRKIEILPGYFTKDSEQYSLGWIVAVRLNSDTARSFHARLSYYLSSESLYRCWSDSVRDISQISSPYFLDQEIAFCEWSTPESARKEKNKELIGELTNRTRKDYSGKGLATSLVLTSLKVVPQALFSLVNDIETVVLQAYDTSQTGFTTNLLLKNGFEKQRGKISFFQKRHKKNNFLSQV